MDTMLILHLAIFVTAVNCAASNLRNPAAASIQPTIPASEATTLKSKRGTSSQAWTSKEIHRPKASNPSASGSYPLPENSSHSGSRTKPSSAYRNVKPRQNVPHGGPNYAPSQSYRNVAPHSTTSAYRSGFRPSFGQPASTQSPVHYSQTPSVRGIESQQNSQISMPYYDAFFNNPSVYNIVADGSKSSAHTKAIPLQNFRGLAQNSLNDKKVLGGSGGLSDFGSFYNSLGQGGKNQGSNNQYVPLYSTKYAPGYQTVTNFAPSGQSAERATQHVAPADATTVDGKRLPHPVLKLQSGQDFPGFLQAFESQPLVLNTNLEYRAQPSFDYNFGAKSSAAQPTGSEGQYASPIIGYQAQVVPIQTASSTPEFPQYRGASVNVFPGVNGPKPAAIYEAIQTQPQLHFGNSGPVVPANTHRTVYHGKPAEEIRDDVEVIKKKKPPPPPPAENDDDDDEELDEGYKQIEREYGRYPADDEDDDSESNKYQDNSKPEGDFKPSNTYPFKAYDEQFGKYSKQGNRDDSDDEQSSKYRGYSSREDDEEEDSYPKFHADYSSKKPRYQKYEQPEEEEESRKQETQEEASEEDSDYEIEPKRLYRGRDFEQEFESSYKKELPQNKYVHVKEVPDIDESHYASSSSKSSRNYQRGNTRHRPRQEESDEPKGQGSRSSYRVKPRANYRDSEGHSSNASAKKTPRVVHEESFGYKTQHDGYPKQSKKGDNKSSKDSYRQSTKTTYKVDKPKAAVSSSAYGNGESYSFSSGDSRKSSESSPEDTYRLPASVTKDSSNLAGQTQRHLSNDARIRSLTTQEVLRSLTGI